MAIVDGVVVADRPFARDGEEERVWERDSERAWGRLRTREIEGGECDREREEEREKMMRGRECENGWEKGKQRKKIRVGLIYDFKIL